MTLTDLLSEYTDRDALAKALDVSPRTVARYENEPDGLPSVTIGGRKLYNIAAVKKWIENRTRHPNRRRRAA